MGVDKDPQDGQEPHEKEIAKTAEEKLINDVNDALVDSFGTAMDDPAALGSKLESQVMHQVANLNLGRLIKAHESVQAHDGDVPWLDDLIHAFGIELPEPGLVGLRALFIGLQEQGESRKLREQPVREWGANRIGQHDILQLVNEPTLIASPVAGVDKMALPSPKIGNVKLVFSGTGLTHPDNQSENPVLIELVIMPPNSIQ